MLRVISCSWTIGWGCWLRRQRRWLEWKQRGNRWLCWWWRYCTYGRSFQAVLKWTSTRCLTVC